MKKIIKNSNENLSFTQNFSFIQNLESVLKVNPILTINPTMDLNPTTNLKGKKALKLNPILTINPTINLKGKKALKLNPTMNLNSTINLKGKKISKLNPILPLNSILKLFLAIFIFNATINLATAANNPVANKNYKIIFKRKVGTDGMTDAESKKVVWYYPNHHDYSVCIKQEKNILEESTTGFFPVSALSAIINQLGIVTEVDGVVKDASGTRGFETYSEEVITKADYDDRKKYNNSLKGSFFEDSFRLGGLFGDNCKNYADNMYNDNKHGLD